MAKYNSKVAVFAYLALLVSIVLMVSTAESSLLGNGFGEEQNISIIKCVKVYGAEAGDTCSLITQNLSLPQDFFFQINPNLNCNTIFVGQWLCIDAVF
ncbi:hypothetical protein FNV43_RR08695 [Rhamnella rubrinervis]|uniref:LysM domain-containing protein n=1 Tax=Rhamnella rubrinervis TaxID=2594499 RepID=A0A8K0H9U7_9ROSA|nr:hypothetical protein FNV43_RR08695 [Rhamnella rubrinervis]